QRALIPLGVLLRGNSEQTWKAQGSLFRIVLITSASQGGCDFRRATRSHFLGTDNEHEIRFAGVDRIHCSKNGGGTRSTGVLAARGGLEAQFRRSLVDKRRGKTVRHKTRVEMPEKHSIDFPGLYFSFLKCFTCSLDDQIFQRQR